MCIRGCGLDGWIRGYGLEGADKRVWIKGGGLEGAD